jgi:hypothetical protein
VRTALLKLDERESQVYSILFLNGGNQARSFLLSKTHLEPDELDLLLENSADLGLVYVLKNRSRLNNSADRVIMNEAIFKTAFGANLILPSPAHALPPELVLENGEFVLTLTAFIRAAGGALPAQILTERCFPADQYEGLRRALLALPKGFEDVWCIAELREEEARTGHARKIHHRIDGQAMLALALKSVSRQRLRACEGVVPGKRELTSFAEAHGFSLPHVKACFSWISQSGWIGESENTLALKKEARAWLRGDMRSRFEALYAHALEDGVVHPNGRIISVSSFIGKNWEKKTLRSAAEYRAYLEHVQNRIMRVTFYWMCGILALHCDEGTIQKISPAGMDEHGAYSDGKAVIAGDMSIVFAENDISPLTQLYLAAFTRVERDSGVVRARLSEKLFAEGIAAGFDGRAFLHALEGASGQPLPQNMTFTIQDWILSRTSARITKPYVLRLSEERADEIMHDPALMKLVDHRAGANDIILGECNEREITLLLEKHGVCLDFDPDA